MDKRKSESKETQHRYQKKEENSDDKASCSKYSTTSPKAEGVINREPEAKQRPITDTMKEMDNAIGGIGATLDKMRWGLSRPGEDADEALESAMRAQKILDDLCGTRRS